MTLLIATQPGSPEIGTWVLIAILVINGLGAMGGLIAIFATRREVESIEKRVGHAEEEIKHETGQLHEKINKVALGTAHLQATTERQNQTLVHIEGKLDRLIERKS